MPEQVGSPQPNAPYRGRLAPTPSGLLHQGHARTFWTAFQRAQAAGGTLVLRIEDLDRARCSAVLETAAIEDLTWLGLHSQESPEKGGPYGPYRQSERLAYYEQVWRQLYATGMIYPSPHSRADVAAALTAPHDSAEEPIFPSELRQPVPKLGPAPVPGAMNWRFRVPDGREIEFVDGRRGPTRRVAGRDFGDFIVWRKDGFPAYELAVVADDHAMQITEVVRGEDLLTSTARQLLLFEALKWHPPHFFHCPLVCDASGQRLAKRHAAESLQALRQQGYSPERIVAEF